MTERQPGPTNGPTTPAAEMRPENIYGDGEGRWFFENKEVTHMSVWWLCPDGHSFTASIAQRVEGVGCPACSQWSGDGS